MRVKVLFLILALLVGIAAVFMSIQMEANSVGDFASYDDELVAHEITGAVGVAGPPIVATQSNYVSAIPVTQAQFTPPPVRATLSQRQNLSSNASPRKPASQSFGTFSTSGFNISNGAQVNSSGALNTQSRVQPIRANSPPIVSQSSVNFASVGQAAQKPSVAPIRNNSFRPVSGAPQVKGTQGAISPIGVSTSQRATRTTVCLLYTSDAADE